MIRKLPSAKEARSMLASDRGNMQEGLQRMEAEAERQLAERPTDEGSVENDSLIREIGLLKALIEELRNTPANQGVGVPPPSYAAGSYVAD